MKKYASLFLLLAIVSAVGCYLFYWYQIRPAQIRHDCSWIKKHTNSIPARTGLTEEQLQAKGMLKTCFPMPSRESNGFTPLTNTGLENIACVFANRDTIDKYKPQRYVPAKDWYEKATPQEYQFCLHDKGL